jgi:chemotaxis protein CheC
MGNEPVTFSNFQLDALKEIGNVGAGNAATALSQMVGKPIGMSVTKVMVLPTAAIAGFLGGMEKNVAAVHMPVYGDVCGVVLIFFPIEFLPNLASLLLQRDSPSASELTELDRSAIKELGSILTGSYLSALFRFINIQMIHGVPTLVIDMAQAILDTVFVDLEQKEEMAIVIETEFMEQNRQLTGSFFLLPESGTLTKFFKAFSKSLGLPGDA